MRVLSLVQCSAMAAHTKSSSVACAESSPRVSAREVRGGERRPAHICNIRRTCALLDHQKAGAHFDSAVRTGVIDTGLLLRELECRPLLLKELIRSRAH